MVETINMKCTAPTIKCSSMQYSKFLLLNMDSNEEKKNIVKLLMSSKIPYKHHNLKED